MRPSNNVGNKTYWDTLKSSANSYETSGSQFLKPSLDYRQDQIPLMNEGLL